MAPRTTYLAKVIRIIALMTTVVPLAGCFGFNDPAKGDLPLANVDLERMYVGWYIVATIPNRLERGIVGNYDVFSPGEKPGWLREDFYMWRGNFTGPKNHLVGRIQVLPESNNADWRVKPIWPLSLPFKIVYVDPDYRYVLFGEQDRNWGWIYSRTQNISDLDYTSLMAEFGKLGWDTSLFRKVIQTPDQVGAPGFWSDGVRQQSQ
jgi:apolipoprotein D and lipocalin family protein